MYAPMAGLGRTLFHSPGYQLPKEKSDGGSVFPRVRNTVRFVKPFCDAMNKIENNDVHPIRDWMQQVRKESSNVRWNVREDISSFQACYSEREKELVKLVAGLTNGYDEGLVRLLEADIKKISASSWANLLLPISGITPGLLAEFRKAVSIWNKLQIILKMGGGTSVFFNNPADYPEYAVSDQVSIYISVYARQQVSRIHLKAETPPNEAIVAEAVPGIQPGQIEAGGISPASPRDHRVYAPRPKHIPGTKYMRAIDIHQPDLED